jgi:hypothetical protein
MAAVQGSVVVEGVAAMQNPAVAGVDGDAGMATGMAG